MPFFELFKGLMWVIRVKFTKNTGYYIVLISFKKIFTRKQIFYSFCNGGYLISINESFFTIINNNFKRFIKNSITIFTNKHIINFN